ncbi:MAG: DHA1 family multidrug resistance protein-like MFS transporter [Glaciecola sp.]|jgi:DHA1 family multidrug resistance protein-like MFS transporter
MTDWKRTYWVVWMANLITSIGMMSFLPFFPSLLEEMGIEGEASLARWSGVCFAAAPLLATFSAPIWGAIGDRYGRKIMVCRAMMAICFFVGAMAFATTPWQLLFLRCLQGCFSGFIPPSITLVSVAAPADQQGRIAGNLATSMAIGGLLGPLIGGMAATILGSHQKVFLLVGLLGGLSAALVWFGAVEDVSTRRQVDGRLSLAGVLRATGSDLREVWNSPVLRSVAWLVFALQIGLGAVNPILELYVRDLLTGVELQGGLLDRMSSLGGAAEGLTLDSRVQTFATSLLFGAMAIANLFALQWWGRYGDRIGHRKALIHCGLLCLLALTVQAAAAAYAVLLVGRLCMGLGMAGASPLTHGLAANVATADRRGSAFGVIFSARTLAVAVGGTLGGLFYPLIGARGVMLGSGLILVGALWIFQVALRHSRRTSEVL